MEFTNDYFFNESGYNTQSLKENIFCKWKAKYGFTSANKF